jgi:Domain of Unknown Function with PDB structure (DUF3857)
MTKTLISTAMLFIAFFSNAQNNEELKVKFGKLSDKEMAMTSYDKDPDAPAVILFDKGYISWGSYDAYERHIRIKIFKKEAYNRANFRILFSRYAHETVDKLRAASYNMENGKWVEAKATSDNILEEAINKYRDVKKVNIPGVKEGSIIEISYTISNPDMKNWTFQDELPTIWSEYEMLVPEFYIFTKIGQGYTPYAVNENDTKSETGYNNFHYRWVQKDVPAIKSEPHITSIEDYRTRITFHLEEIRPPQQLIKKYMGNWHSTSKHLMEHEDFGDFIGKKSAMKEELASFIKEAMTPLEKTQAVYEYVGKNFDTESYADGSVYVTSFLKTIKQKRKVSVSEINLIFLNMLNTLGIKASPVITRSREDGRVATNLAALGRFNRTIALVKIEKDTFFVDVSGYPQPMKLLPFNALSGYGVALLENAGYDMVTPQSKMATRQFAQANLSLNTEGVLSGDINLIYSGYDAYNHRKAIKNDGLDKFVQDLTKELITEGKLQSHKFENTELLAEIPLKGALKLSTSAFVNKTDDKIYINPMLCYGEKENPFKAEERKYDVDFGAAKDKYFQMSLTLPEGYKVEEAPKTVRLQMPEANAKFEYLFEIKENKITLNTKLTFKRTNFYTDEYASLKQFYSQMLAKMGEQIVLTKAAK